VIADWPQIARLVRSETLSELNKPYVEALLVLGVKKPRIIFRHVLKNISFFLASIVALHVAFIITFPICAGVHRFSALVLLVPS